MGLPRRLSPTAKEPILKRCLQVIVAEPEESRFLRDRISCRRRIRHTATEQECIDLGYAGAGDVMLIDLDALGFADPEIIGRIRFVSRNTFPILGIASRGLRHPDNWLRAGLATILPKDSLTPFALDRTLRHWVKHHRLKVRLFDANRRALRWWDDLVTALDEMRLRMEKSSDSLEAYLTLLDAGEGDIPSLRRSTIANARKQVAEIHHLAEELDVAARTIQLEGIEKSHAQRKKPDGRSPFSMEALMDAAVEEERGRLFDPPAASTDREEHRRYGT